MTYLAFDWMTYEKVPLDGGQFTYEAVGMRHYGITQLDCSHILFERDDESKVVSVQEDSEFTYKLLKTKIRAIGGATGLMDYFASCYGTDYDLWSSTPKHICDYAIDEMEGAR